jgi:hypothetical protein
MDSDTKLGLELLAALVRVAESHARSILITSRPMILARHARQLAQLVGGMRAALDIAGVYDEQETKPSLDPEYMSDQVKASKGMRPKSGPRMRYAVAPLDTDAGPE